MPKARYIVGPDLRAVMAETVARLTADGWHVEGDFQHGSFFCSRGEVRCLVQLRSTDPASPTYGPSSLS